jgi:PAS domain S-box-containing protein
VAADATLSPLQCTSGHRRRFHGEARFAVPPQPAITIMNIFRSFSGLVLFLLVVAAFCFHADIAYTQNSELAPGLFLSAEEQAWLEAHSTITLGSPIIPPWNFVDEKTGQYRGIVPDYLDLIASKLGIAVKTIADNFGKIHQMAREKTIDGISVVGKTAEREQFLNFPAPYITLQYSIVTQKESPAVTTFADLGRRRAGILEASAAYSYLKKNYPDVELMTFKAYDEGLLAVLNGEIDAWIGSLAGVVYAINDKGLFGLQMKVVPFEMSKEMGVGIRKDWPELIPIINKAIASIDQREHTQIRNKWLAHSPEDREEKIVTLSPEEQAWLAKNHTVRVRVVDWPPYLIVKDDEPPQGIAIEYLKLIGDRTGITFGYEVTDQPFAEFLKAMQQQKGPDMTAVIVPTPEREPYLSFSQVYIASPYVIFTREADDLLLDISGLAGKTLSVSRGSAVQARLTRDFPEIRLSPFDSDAQALQAVATGQADAYIGSLTIASHIVHRDGLSGLRVAAHSPFGEQTLAMGNRKDWPELTAMIRKALASISEEEKTAIRDKYVALRYEQGIDTAAALRWIIFVVGGAFGIIALFIGWNRSLAKKVRDRTADLESSNQNLSVQVIERTKAEHALRENRDYLKTLMDSLPDAVFSLKLPQREIVWASDTFNVFGYDPDECVGKTMAFLYPDKQGFLSVGNAIERAIAEERDLVRVDQTMQKKSGECFPADITISLFRTNADVVSVTAIVRDIAERKLAEEKLQAYQERLKALAAQLTLAEEKERQRIAAELHDQVGQSLAFARMRLAAAKKHAGDERLKGILNDISESLLKAGKDTRHLIFDLSSPAMREIGLRAAIAEWLEDEVQHRHGIPTAFIDKVNPQHKIVLPLDIRTLLFRNVRELLTNAVKHAQAKQITVYAEAMAGDLVITVEDDGVGFEAPGRAPNANKDAHFGLFSIQERMADLGGALELVSEPGEGCRATLRVPLSLGEQ